MRGRIVRFSYLARRRQRAPQPVKLEPTIPRKPWIFRLLDKTAAVRDLVHEALLRQCAQCFADWDAARRQFITQLLFAEMVPGRVVPVENAFPQLLLDLEPKPGGRASRDAG